MGLKQKTLRFLKGIWLLSFLRRMRNGLKYTWKNFISVIKWGLNSNEYTNYTYHLSPINKIYMAHFVGHITHTNTEQVLSYFKEAEDDNELIQHIINETQKSNLAKYADTEVRFSRRLAWYAFTRILKPKLVVETGVDKGLGSVLLCSALLKNQSEGYSGYYYGTDIDPKAGYLLKGKYTEVGKILYGDSIESLNHLDKIIDIFINDSDHSSDYEYREYQTIKNKLNEKSIIIGDNAHATDKLEKFANETHRQFLFFREEPIDTWFPGCGIGVAFSQTK